MPPFVQGLHKQFNEQENQLGYNIASVCIHVEHLIQHLKLFHILDKIEWNLLPHLDDILIVISYCVNHFPPLIKAKTDENIEDLNVAEDE